jgi:hypothetical protein
MKQNLLRCLELLLLVISGFAMIPAVSSTDEPPDLMPMFAVSIGAYGLSLVLAYLRKAENPYTLTVKLLGFSLLAWAIHLRCVAA